MTSLSAESTMAANKGAPRRKRAASESGGAKRKPTEAAKKRQTVAAKRKYVRELAKAGRWSEVNKQTRQWQRDPYY